MKITPLARVFIAVVSLAVIAWVLWERQREAPQPVGVANTGGAPMQPVAVSDAPPPPPPPPPASGGVPGMVFIAGGSFLAGQGRQPATVAPFYIDRTEVTNTQYAAYLRTKPGAAPPYFSDPGYLAAHGEFPVVSVGYEDARQMCASQGKRLPTGLEWERAARGTDGRELPWGNDLDPGRARLMANDPASLAAAAQGIPTFAVNDPRHAGDVSPDGVMGLAGNVGEWTSDPGGAGEYMVRGGSWASYQLTDAVTHRAVPTRGDLRATRVGFRCAVGQAEAAQLSVAPAQGGRLAQIRAAGVLRVGAEPNTPPMLVAGPNGAYAGFDYEVARALADHLGVAVQIVPGRYSELPGALAAGQFDVIVSGYTPDPTLAAISWSAPYLEFGLCLVAKTGGGIRRVSDLAGKRVGVFNDPVAERVARQLAPAAQSISPYEDGYFQLLDTGAIDAFIYDFPYAQAELAPFGARLSIVEYNLSAQTYAVGVPASAPDLLAEVNAALGALRGAPAYKKMVRQWLGKAKAVEDFAPGERVYTVRPGDSLSAIAEKQLGDVEAWPRIWEANRHRIGNPDLIDVGMKIAIP